ncbi:MAG: hypothetical protein WBF33_33910 [Candidatus Nitrosopolaris sp.]
MLNQINRELTWSIYKIGIGRQESERGLEDDDVNGPADSILM